MGNMGGMGGGTPTISTTQLPNPSGSYADNNDMKNFAAQFLGILCLKKFLTILDAFDKKRNMIGNAYTDTACFSMTVQVGQWTDNGANMSKQSKDDLNLMLSRSRNLLRMGRDAQSKFSNFTFSQSP
jgi:hypothetical protein